MLGHGVRLGHTGLYLGLGLPLLMKHGPAMGLFEEKKRLRGMCSLRCTESMSIGVSSVFNGELETELLF